MSIPPSLKDKIKADMAAGKSPAKAVAGAIVARMKGKKPTADADEKCPECKKGMLKDGKCAECGYEESEA
jgi:hypothetical protein